MNSKEKIKELKTIIEQALTPIINNDYVYLDLPYHNNIGDTLIWKGTESFLKTIPYNCLYRASFETYIKPKINKDIVILLHGGGNLGDLYEAHNKFRLDIIKAFPDNPIIILPQTAYYSKEEPLKLHAQAFAKHQNLTLCARDYVTQDLFKNNFSKNNILLVPDMAFCISESFIEQFKGEAKKNYLYFKRSDIEFVDVGFKDLFKGDEAFDTSDWPTYESDIKAWKNYLRILKIKSKLPNNTFFNKITAKFIDWYFINIYFPQSLKVGIEFISNYKHIYSTRLHAAILSILLDKKITFLNNSYGKNSNFYKAWLENLDSIELVINN